MSLWMSVFSRRRDIAFILAIASTTLYLWCTGIFLDSISWSLVPFTTRVG